MPVQQVQVMFTSTIRTGNKNNTMYLHNAVIRKYKYHFTTIILSFWIAYVRLVVQWRIN